MIEVENDRKNKELDSARDLQLSLLPQSIPNIKGVDIAAFMKTATEVGGDYYDFIETPSGGLLVAIGDATGHGLKAGNMVIATKGLLNVLSGTDELDTILTSANRAIKRMNLHMLTMCLALARIEGHQLRYSSAGMPPLFVYRKKTGSTEQLTLKAMPLGAVHEFPYKQLNTELFEGDVLAMVSDGLVEMFNASRENYGMENIAETLQNNVEKPAQEIVNNLIAGAAAWSGETPLEDDLTIVVIKLDS